MSSTPYLPPKILNNFASQICCGISFLHSQGIIHRDIAARNMLIDRSHSVVKVSDFGLSKTLDSLYYTSNCPVTVPIRWTAIESIQKRKVWSKKVSYIFLKFSFFFSFLLSLMFGRLELLL